MNDRYFMNIALQIAWFKKGKTSPNPTVGAILVKDNLIISWGVTQVYGGYHAERMALKDLNKVDTENSTLYVTLEPCTFQGNTPPCTDIIIQKKIKRVVIACLDPHPEVAGKGVRLLKENGIEVKVSVLESKAKKINADFFKWIKAKKPLVTLKYASTLDGRIATKTGDSKWITNEKARRMTHILRYRCDAILVGVNTIIHDNPTLNARLPNRKKTLLRVILDPDAKTPLNSNVIVDELPSLFVVKENKLTNQMRQRVEGQKNKRIWVDKSLAEDIDLESLLTFLGKINITSLFVEGGSYVLGSFLKNNFGDQIFIFFGTQILGEGLSPFNGFKNDYIKEAVDLKGVKWKKLADNFLVYGELK